MKEYKLVLSEAQLRIVAQGLGYIMMDPEISNEDLLGNEDFTGVADQVEHMLGTLKGAPNPTH